ncbi:transcriptional regulator [Streptococcus moroccensis]|uniref:Transcriptional regulator with XRE-family HTH domain n=1 Tax=Streptococcus moroccensis TaxID=1451356 RepID=A0ABT9YQL2_9STRE|nr:transcriptional regulator [Streptococcus moroccensis]MDQ0222019.1 transcriptional regulator with XRE-family HTH domain [Streptococcus moroccensis]
MSQQHQKWIDLVIQKMNERRWTKSDLAQVIGVSAPMITRLLNDGHGSDNLKLAVSKKLGIREPWEEFEEV